MRKRAPTQALPARSAVPQETAASALGWDLDYPRVVREIKSPYFGEVGVREDLPLVLAVAGLQYQQN